MLWGERLVWPVRLPPWHGLLMRGSWLVRGAGGAAWLRLGAWVAWWLGWVRL